MHRLTRGNVFADLGLPDPGERHTRTRLAIAFNHIFKDRSLKHAEAAALQDMPQPKVSAQVPGYFALQDTRAVFYKPAIR